MDLVKRYNPFSKRSRLHQQQQPEHHLTVASGDGVSDRRTKKVEVTERELENLNQKIESLLANLDDQKTEGVFSDDEECVVCLSAKATIRTFPCGHCVVCRRCFVRTIQTALAERRLPLKCVLCRTKILKLRQPLRPFAPSLPSSSALSCSKVSTMSSIVHGSSRGASFPPRHSRPNPVPGQDHCPSTATAAGNRGNNSTETSSWGTRHPFQQFRSPRTRRMQPHLIYPATEGLAGQNSAITIQKAQLGWRV